jgi:hypothetical protein
MEPVEAPGPGEDFVLDKLIYNLYNTIFLIIKNCKKITNNY